MLFDTHAHVNFAAFRDDADEVLKRCSDQKIGVINIGSQFSTSKRAVEMAEKYETGVWAAVGLHPGHLFPQNLSESDYGEKFKSSAEKFDWEKYSELAKNEKTVAVGETGLEFQELKKKDKSDAAKIIEMQKNNFLEHIKFAAEFNLPMIIHCREAYKEVLEIITSEKKKYGEKLRGVMHSYLGRLSYAEQFNKRGFLIAFNGIITYARDYDKVIKGIALENILVETDCPWLTPVPYRGQRNEPAYVKLVAEKIAEIKGVSFDEVADRTTKNTRELFHI